MVLAILISALLADSVGPAGKVVAIDPIKSRLELANKQYSRPNLVFLEVNDVTFPEDQYDLVFSNYVLHWIENKNALLKMSLSESQTSEVSLHLLYVPINLQLLSNVFTAC